MMGTIVVFADTNTNYKSIDALKIFIILLNFGSRAVTIWPAYVEMKRVKLMRTKRETYPQIIVLPHNLVPL